MKKTNSILISKYQNTNVCETTKQQQQTIHLQRCLKANYLFQLHLIDCWLWAKFYDVLQEGERQPIITPQSAGNKNRSVPFVWPQAGGGGASANCQLHQLFIGTVFIPRVALNESAERQSDENKPTKIIR